MSIFEEYGAFKFLLFFFSQLSKNCWMMANCVEPGQHVFCDVWSGSILFVQTCLSNDQIPRVNMV